MKIKLENEENVIVILCERKKANLKIIYKDINTNEVIKENFIDDLQLGQELDVELIPPNNYKIIEEKKEENDIYEEMLKEMREFRKEMEK
ncbi:MAG: hypothetical protein II309_05585 [Bacilli bacterium]|jgi:hypothetical protein|nr:hypothetical protein [Bacilli bacterium]